MAQHRWLRGRHTALLVEVGDPTVPVVRALGPAPDADTAEHDEAGAARDVVATTAAQAQASVDGPLALDLLPMHAVGLQGTPALRGAFADGTGWAPRLTRVRNVVDASSLTAMAEDPDAGLRLHVQLTLDEHDVLRLRAAVTNVRGDVARPASEEVPVPTPGLGRRTDHAPSADDYHLDALRLTLPVGDQAREVTSFAGRWIREFHLQRQPWQVGRIERVNVRGRLHGGRVVRVDHPDPNAVVHGVVTPERGLFSHCQLRTSDWARPAAVRMPGFERGCRYRVELIDVLTDPPAGGCPPAWYADGHVEVSGALLADHGLALHAHHPETASVVQVVAVS